MDYSTPFVVKSEFQNVQKQTTWLAGEVVDDKKLLIQARQDLECLWVQFLQEHHYVRHLIDEHLLVLQKAVDSKSCQCRIVGDWPSTTLYSFPSPEPQLWCPSSLPSLESISKKLTCDSLWESLQRINHETKMLSPVKEGGGPDEAEDSDKEDSSEAWEDCGSDNVGGSGSGGGSDPDA